MSSDHSANSIFKITLNLTVACLVSGTIIAITQYLTADEAVRKSAENATKKMQKLLSGTEEFKAIPNHEKWYGAYKDGKLIAYIVPSETKGYGGVLKLITAITPEGKVMNFSIKETRETPGLGDKAELPPFRDQFKGKELANLKVTKNPSNKEEILAITGATITSRAVTECVKDAVVKLNAFLKEAK